MDLRDPGEVVALLFVRILKVGHVLEEVRVEGLFGERGVRRHIIGEFDDLEVIALFGYELFDDVHDVLMREWGDPDLDLFAGGEGRGGDDQCC